MSGRLVFQIGVSLEETDREIAANVKAAIAAANAGGSLEPSRTVSFENWNTFCRCMTPNRTAVLQHVALHHVVASMRELSIALGQDYSGVHAGVAELVTLGSLERNANALRD